MGLGLMEGLGSALLRRPSLEPAALVAYRLFLKGAVVDDDRPVHDVPSRAARDVMPASMPPKMTLWNGAMPYQ